MLTGSRQQNDVTFAYLATIPEREKIIKRMTELWDYERFGLPYKEGVAAISGDTTTGSRTKTSFTPQRSLDEEPQLCSLIQTPGPTTGR